ncbi:MAG: carboxylating nicotinate-nucleotide diphosphorylase [Candidatus Eisenbacteria bacterium]|nr:carboxylating nicotinate-nucleotide diphosphorylase [Candidatus Eisenbacteria bacterium]
MTIDACSEQLIRMALEEDLGTGDVTTDSIVPEGHESSGVFIANQKGVVAGLEVAAMVFGELARGVEMDVIVADGGEVGVGDRVAVVRGKTRAIVSGERVALNFLQRLSGVATATSELVARLAGTKTRLLDTRKTTPGMRSLEKQAVVLGGGTNHRMGLWDMALIKDNHIAAAGGIGAAVAAVRERRPDVRIEVEVEDGSQLEEALEAGVHRIMLDNMPPTEMERCIAAARAHPSRPEIEISGGVSAESLAGLAELGADFISVGAITHSAPALDITLELGGEE